MGRARPRGRVAQARAPGALAGRHRRRARRDPRQLRGQADDRPGAAADRRPPAARPRAVEAQLPLRPLDLRGRRRGRPRPGLTNRPPRLLRPRGRDLREPPLPGHALPLRRDRGSSARLGARRSCIRCPPRPTPPKGRLPNEGRHRRHAERRQVDPLQRADQRRRRGGRLPVHDDRAERGDRSGSRRAPRRRRRDHRIHAGRPRGARGPRHRRPRARRPCGRGPRQPLSRLDPRDRRDLPRRPRAFRLRRPPSRRRDRPGGGRGDGRGGADARRPGDRASGGSSASPSRRRRWTRRRSPSATGSSGWSPPSSAGSRCAQFRCRPPPPTAPGSCRR